MSIPTEQLSGLLTFPETEKSPLSIRAKALVFIDPASRALREQLQQLAPQPLPVLIHGETGTGKELLARHVHQESARAGLFVSVSCGGLSPRFAQAELFGQSGSRAEVGVSSRAGWFGSAHGGTLYLDEVADLSPLLQERLLAALENHEVLRVGAQVATPVDVRLVAATSIDLARAVQAGHFNERLYQYLNEGYLALPALRERRADILPMAEYFLGIYSHKLNLPLPAISLASQALLQAYSWPGNTRELENVIHFAVLQSHGPELLPEHLGLPGAPLSAEGLLQQLAQWPAEQRQQFFAQLTATLGV